ncbi:MAG: ABC transporter ATP-binding protein [Gammaproteobacteria bacterium]|nr:ABC transporter ATP-binding protein [Gammaproteobacteria bacterium]
MTEAPPPLIQVQALAKCYQVGAVRFPALRGVDLAVDRGELTAVAGRSGSGKTTLLNLIAGLEQPTRGSVRVAGEDFSGWDRNARAAFRLHHIGFVFQAFNLVRVLSARENVAFVCQLQGRDRRRCLELADHWLAEVGLAGLGDRRPDQLSGGHQQRVAVARALAVSPDIVLADEPTANLDSATALALVGLLQHINQEFGTTFLIASHDHHVIEQARRVVRLEDGRVVTGLEPTPRLAPEEACPGPDRLLRHRVLKLLADMGCSRCRPRGQ